MGDLPIRVRLDFTRAAVKEESHKIVWYPVSRRAVNKIADLKSDICGAFELKDSSTRLFIDDALLRDEDTILLLRENDIIQVISENIPKKSDATKKRSKRKLHDKSTEDINSGSFLTAVSNELNLEDNYHPVEITPPTKKAKKKKKKEEEGFYQTFSLTCNGNKRSLWDSQLNVDDTVIQNGDHRSLTSRNIEHPHVSNGTQPTSDSNDILSLPSDSNDTLLPRCDSNDTLLAPHDSNDILPPLLLSLEPPPISLSKTADVETTIIKEFTPIKKRKRTRRKRKKKNSNLDSSQSVNLPSFRNPISASSYNLQSNKHHIKFDDCGNGAVAKDRYDTDINHSEGMCENFATEVEVEVTKGNGSNVVDTIESCLSEPQLPLSGVLQSDSISPKNAESGAVVQQQNKNLAPAQEMLPKDYSQFKTLNTLPDVGTRIAFKILELSDTYCPEVSDYKVGTITDIDNEVELLTIKLDKKEYKVRTGKFEVFSDDEDKDVVNVSVAEIELVSRRWNELIDPRVLP